MTTLVTREWARPPEVARLGFDDGWLILRPTFLNLQMPVIVVDQAFVGDPHRYGLEPFGTRSPDVPLPMTGLTTSILGAAITVCDRSTGEVVTSKCLRAQSEETLLSAADIAVIFVGRTYHLELTWAALWKMSVGHTLMC